MRAQIDVGLTGYLVYFVIPSIFLTFGAIAKRIIRGPHWKWSDWFLGVELVLAAMSTGATHALDLTMQLNRMLQSPNSPVPPPKLAQQLLSVILFLIATIVLFLSW